MKRVLLILLFLIPFVVKANNIGIKDIDIKDSSPNVIELDKPLIENNTITTNNHFCEENQYIKYSFTIENNSPNYYYLSSVSDSSIIKYKIDFEKNELKAGESIEGIITMTLTDTPDEDVIEKAYIVLTEREPSSKKIDNPKTSTLNASFVILLIILLIGIIFITKKYKIKWKLFVISILLVTLSTLIYNTYSIDIITISINSKISYTSSCNSDVYGINTTGVQKQFHTYDTFTTSGIKITKNGVVIDYATPEVIEYPNLKKSGKQTVKLKYNDKEYEYEINVRANKVGDLITLKDGSSWYYLSSDNNNINLLSVYLLKEKCDSTCKLSFATNKDTPNDIYKNKFDESNQDYDNSSIKTTLYNEFKTPYLETLRTNYEVDTSSIEIDLPNAELLNDLLGGDGNDEYLTGDNYDRYVATILRGFETYWTKTKRNDTTQYTIHVDNGKISYKSNSKSEMDYAIRPQMTIPKDKLEKLIIKEDNNTNGTLDLVSSLGYIIYDVDNNRVIRQEQKIDSRYDRDLVGDELHLGLNSNEYILPASVTKVTTITYALEKMKAYQISLDDVVDVNPKVKTCSNAFYSSGGQKIIGYDQVTYRDLIYASLYASSWDAVVQLAVSLTNKNGQMGINNNFELGLDTSSLTDSYEDCEKLDAQFAKEMTNYVKTTILNNNSKTNYVNASGNLRDDHQTTLYDTARIMGYAMKNTDLYDIYNNNETRKVYTSNFAKSIVDGDEVYLSINNLNYPLFGLTYYIGGKIGNAAWPNRDLRSGHNWVNYYEKNGHGYVIFTAEADSNIETYGNKNMINDQILIYQWLFG